MSGSRFIPMGGYDSWKCTDPDIESECEECAGKDECDCVRDDYVPDDWDDDYDWGYDV